MNIENMNIELYIIAGITIIGLGLILVLKNSISAGNKAWVDEAIDILRKIETSSNSDLRFRMIEYDKLMEYILQGKCKNKKSIGFNLKNKGLKFFEKNELNQLWKVHKVRNEIVHNNHQTFSKNNLENSCNQYSIILKKILYR